MADTYPNFRSRVGGSGFTVWFWDNSQILFAQQVSDQSPQPVAPVTPIHPLDEPYATEIVSAAAADPGTLTIRLYERYTLKAWEQLGVSLNSNGNGGSPNSLSGTTDVIDVLVTIAQAASPLTILKVIRPPKLSGVSVDPYYEQYHKCVVATVADTETVEVGTMQILKDITVQYAYKTRPNTGGLGFSLRDRSFGSLPQ